MLCHAWAARQLEPCDSMLPVTSDELSSRFMFLSVESSLIRRWQEGTRQQTGLFSSVSQTFWYFIFYMLGWPCTVWPWGCYQASSPAPAELQLCSSLAVLLALQGWALALAHPLTWLGLLVGPASSSGSAHCLQTLQDGTRERGHCLHWGHPFLPALHSLGISWPFLFPDRYPE